MLVMIILVAADVYCLPLDRTIGYVVADCKQKVVIWVGGANIIFCVKG
jgi:hypothetical protein